MSWKFGRIFVVIVFSLLVPVFVYAQDTRGGSRRVIELGEEIIEGRIEKPEAFYILRPTNLEYEAATAEESFLPELLETVNEPLFQ